MRRLSHGTHEEKIIILANVIQPIEVVSYCSQNEYVILNTLFLLIHIFGAISPDNKLLSPQIQAHGMKKNLSSSTDHTLSSIYSLLIHARKSLGENIPNLHARYMS